MTRNNRWWIVLGSVFGLLVGNGPIMVFTFGVFLLPLTKDFGWSRSDASLALVVGSIATGLCVPLAGRLVDKFGIRKVTIPAITLFALSLVALALLANTPTKFVLIYAFMGVVAAGQTPLPYAKSISAWFDDKRGLALGIAMSGVGLGAALVPQFAQQLVNNVGWRGAYIGLAILTFVVGLTAAGLALREPPQLQGKKGEPAAVLPGKTAREALRSGVFWKLVIAFVSVALATNGVIAHVVPMLVDRGVDASVATRAMAFAGLALIGGRLLAGAMLDRYFAPYVAVFFFAIPLLGIGLLLTSLGTTYAALAVVLVGLGLGAEVDLIAFMLSRYLGLKSFGEIYGYLFAAFMLGTGVGPFAMGAVFDATGNYDAALFGLGGLLLLSCFVLISFGQYAYPQARKSVSSRSEAQPAKALSPSVDAAQ